MSSRAQPISQLRESSINGLPCSSPVGPCPPSSATLASSLLHPSPNEYFVSTSLVPGLWRCKEYSPEDGPGPCLRGLTQEHRDFSQNQYPRISRFVISTLNETNRGDRPGKRGEGVLLCSEVTGLCHGDMCEADEGSCLRLCPLLPSHCYLRPVERTA